jgi:hypothetical protein
MLRPVQIRQIVLNKVARWMIPASMDFHSSESITNEMGSSCLGRALFCDAVVVNEPASIMPATGQTSMPHGRTMRGIRSKGKIRFAPLQRNLRAR